MTHPDSPRSRNATSSSDPGGGRDSGDAAGRFAGRAAALATSVPGWDLPGLLCRAAVEVLAVDGVGITVLAEPDVCIPVAASDGDVAAAEALEFTLGQGPCWQAYRSTRAVLIPDLDQPTDGAGRQWPVYAALLVTATPFRALLTVPLAPAGGPPLGAVSFYRRRPADALTVARLADLHQVAAVISTCLLHPSAPAEPGSADPDPADRFRWLDTPSARRRQRVWQAVGMAAGHWQLPARDALALLRARAFSADRHLDDMAADVLTGRLPLHHLHP